ncbi:MAG: CBM51, partial [uncultured Phycisphaerae bacterium]
QDAWSLTTADLKTESVGLKAFDSAAGLKVAPLAARAADRDVPADRFVELARPLSAAPRTGKFDLHLVGGDRLNGDPAGMRGESVVWRNPVAGEVVVPLTRLAGLTRANDRFAADRRRDDVATLANGDAVRGTLTDLTAEQVVIKTDAGDAPVPFASLANVTFAATVQAGGAKLKPSFRVRLDEGSVLAATAVKLSGDKIEATVGGAAKALPLGRVAAVEQVNGPVAFLSSLQPSASLYTPYLGSDQRFVARMNADFDGNPVRFRDRVYPRAIATHSYSKLTWPLDGTYAAFRARYAMDPKAAAGTGGDVTVRVLLDDKVVHERKNVRPGQLSDPVVLDVTGAKTISLEVDYGQMIDSNDRLNWLEPALLKEKPAGEPGGAGK